MANRVVVLRDQIERVELLTLAQAANAVLWTLQAYFKAVSSLPLLFAGMVFVGLLGGASCECAASPPDYTTPFALASATSPGPIEHARAQM